MPRSGRSPAAAPFAFPQANLTGPPGETPPARFDADAIDAIAERQKRELAAQGLLEHPLRQLPRLKCAACLIRIGPGYHEHEVWYDREKRRPICRSCALWPTMPPSRVAPLVDSGELETLSLGELNRIIRARSRSLDKERT